MSLSRNHILMTGPESLELQIPDSNEKIQFEATSRKKIKVGHDEIDANEIETIVEAGSCVHESHRPESKPEARNLSKSNTLTKPKAVSRSIIDFFKPKNSFKPKAQVIENVLKEPIESQSFDKNAPQNIPDGVLEPEYLKTLPDSSVDDCPDHFIDTADQIDTEKDAEKLEILVVDQSISSRPSRSARLKSKPLDFTNSKSFENESITANLDLSIKPKRALKKIPSDKTSKPFFFMTQNEKSEQIILQKSIDMKIKLMETSKATNSITQSSSVNPFFAIKAKKPKSNDENSGIPQTSSWPQCEAPFPNKDQNHVGWISASAVLSSTLPASTRKKVELESLDKTPYNLKPIQTYNSKNQDLQFKRRKIDFSVIKSNLTKDFADISSLPYFTKISESLKPFDIQNTLWRDATAPVSYEYIHETHNRNICIELIEWLKAWSQEPDQFHLFKQSVNSDVTRRRKKKNDFIVSDDEDDDERDDEFISSSQKYRESEPLDYNPVVMIIGPSGSSKSTIVRVAAAYAGYHILEISSSEKRSGKVLNEILLSASTSHTVKGKLSSFFDQEIDDIDSILEMGKTCILLEDIDFLAEEDRGFWTSLHHVISNTKCPIIMTCSDNPLNSNNPQIMTGLSELLAFTRKRYTKELEPESLIKFLSLTAVFMGYYIHPSILKKMQLSKFDQGLNQLQFICSTSVDHKEADVSHGIDWNEIILYNDIPERIKNDSPHLPPISDLYNYLNAKTYLSVDHTMEPEYNALESLISFPTVSLSNADFPYSFSDNGKLQNSILNKLETDFDKNLLATPYSDFNERMSIYNYLDPYTCISSPGIVAMDFVPYLSLICRHDGPKNVSDNILGKRGSRSSRKTAKKHIRYLESGEHELLARPAFANY